MTEPAASPVVLLVEDYPPSMYATGRVLRQAGFEVREAENGTDALRMARDLPDLVVLDINLPDVDGFEVCRRLKADPHTRAIPVLQLSAARRGTDDRAQGLEGGADAYLTQPVPPRELVATIGALLRMRRAEQEAGAARERAEALVRELDAERVRLRAALAAAGLAQSEAEDASRAKGRFLATMSHEIRTPINAIIGYADLLEVGIHGALSPGQQAQLERIKASSRHLLGLVNDILDLSKVEAGGVVVQLAPYSIGETTAAALSMVAPQAAAKRIRVEVESCPETVLYLGDEDRVRQILVNLLSNAVKFTEVGGGVAVRCGPADGPEAPGGGGRWVRVAVEDTGIGIAPEELGRVFEPFVQVDAEHTRRQGGTGLGLTISLRFARLMGGDISVESRPGEGSLFTLWLPAAPAEGADVPERGDERGEAPVEGLAALGQAVMRTADAAVAAMAERLRADPAVPSAAALDRVQLEDHQAALLAAVGSALTTLEEAGTDAVRLQDGSDIQRMIARRHGVQRRRLGWTAAEMEREYQVLREETEAAALRECPGLGAPGYAGALEVLRRVLDRAERRSIRGFEDGMDALPE